MTGREKGEELKLPALVVFDLDDCCWYPALDEMAGEPYSSERPAGGEEGLGRVVDRRGHEIALFPGMRKILLELHSGAKWAQTKVATASRTHCVEAAAQVLGLMELGESGLVMKDIFHENQIYPGCKKKHFRRLQRDTGVAFEDMLFFDDW